MFGIEYGKSIVDFGNFEFSQLGDAFLFGGAMLLIGMVTIFAVLSLLWACLVLFKVCFHDLPQKKKEDAKSTAVIEEAAPTVVSKDNSTDEIVAVIAAAIAMAESESSGAKFKVVAFRRK